MPEAWTVYVLGFPTTEQLVDPQIGDKLRIEGINLEVTKVDRASKTLSTKRV